MTVLVHKLLDAIREERTPIERLPGQAADAVLGELNRELLGAEKFDFQVLPLERMSDPGAERATVVNDTTIISKATGSYALPTLTRDEMMMWNEGFIPLPAPRCWYEFTLGTTRTGLFVGEKDAGTTWYVTLVDYAPRNPGEPPRFWVNGLILMVKRDPAQPDGIGVQPFGSPELIKYLEEKGTLRQWCANAYLAIYLTLMLSSRTTSKVIEHPPVALNKRRIARGHAPMTSFRVVNLVPDCYRGEPGSGTHASPRLHWRRSHLRRYDHQTPGSKWCSTLGCYATVIPRHLVGRAELGEVSHEYKMSIDTMLPTAGPVGSR